MQEDLSLPAWVEAQFSAEERKPSTEEHHDYEAKKVSRIEWLSTG